MDWDIDKHSHKYRVEQNNVNINNKVEYRLGTIPSVKQNQQCQGHTSKHRPKITQIG